MRELENDLMESLENLNLKYIDLLNSKELRVGKNISSIKKSIRERKLSKFFSLIRKKYYQRKIDKKFNVNLPKENLSEDLRIKNTKHEDINGKVAIYSCITGGYDDVIEPIFKNDGFDFYIFSDKQIVSNTWKYRSLPNEVRNLDNVLINRYVKMHPFDLFDDYDFAVYVDGNVCIASDISPLIKTSKVAKTGFSMHNHVLRDCIYDEAEICKMYGKGNSLKLDSQIKRYKDEGFPLNYGLLEATIIFFDLNSNNCKRIMNNWWNEFMNSGSYRDQVALPYVLWKNGYVIRDVGKLGENLYRNPKFHVISH